MDSSMQYRVNLNFTADSASAMSEIGKLQNALSSISNISSVNKGFISDKSIADMQKASVAANELSMHLKKATNAATGRLNLKEFNMSLANAGTNVNLLGANLMAAGNQGVQAFSHLATVMAQAETKTIGLAGKMKPLMDTLQRGLLQQLSSQIFNRVIGGIGKAYGYVQKLNTSLSNIRIVTGQNIDQMKQFAEQANKAAQALSTTTTNYTDASLIYYQQGLKGKDVTDRTDVTIKMANVSGQSASEVSDQMTAIWNNFADGSKTLEYYADVITALGASTASSSSEIAEGVEKFASIAKTTGLSYEYATSALATLVATTRQSADTVGNSLKTIFARLQGLSLGDTLEDGVDLNKYSKALNIVGVQIIDENNNLKSLDNILSELAGKWQGLGDSQKTALAQTVAGVRQYNNLIALMDNWDSMQKNVETATDSEGTLQEQQSIYEESWKAASARVKAAMEEIYAKLLDDQFFIKFTNGLADVIKFVSQLTSGLGGVKGIFLGLFTMFMQNSPKIAEFFNNSLISLSMFGKKAEQVKQQTVEGILNNTSEAATKSFENTTGGEEMMASYSKVGELQKILAKNYGSMSDASRQAATKIIQDNEDILASMQKRYDTMQKSEKSVGGYSKQAGMMLKVLDPNTIRSSINSSMSGEEMGRLSRQANNIESLNATGNVTTLDGQTYNLDGQMKQYTDLEQKIGQCEVQARAFSDSMSKMTEQELTGDLGREKFEQLKDTFGTTEQVAANFGKKAGEIYAQMQDFASKGEYSKVKELSEDFQAVVSVTGNASPALANLKNILMDIVKACTDDTEVIAKFEKKLNTAGSEARGLGRNIQTLKDEEDKLNHTVETSKKTFQDLKVGVQTAGQVMQSIASSFTSVCFVINSVTNASKVLNDENATTVEKLSAVVMAVMAVGRAYQTVTAEKNVAQLTKLVKLLPGVAVPATEAAAGTTAAAGGMTSLAGATTVSAAALGWWLIIIAAVVAALYLIEDAIYSNKEALEDAQKAAKGAEDNLNAIEESIKSLDEAFNGLDDGYDRLKNMTSGTAEWRAEIAELNSEVIDLLSNYGLLDKDNYTVDETGVYHIKDNVREELNNKLAEERINALNYNQAAKGLLKVAEAKESRKEASQLPSFLTMGDNQSFTLRSGKDLQSAMEEAYSKGILEIGNDESLAKWLKDNLITNIQSVYNDPNEAASIQQQMVDDQVEYIVKNISDETLKIVKENADKYSAAVGQSSIYMQGIVEQQFKGNIDRMGDKAASAFTNFIGGLVSEEALDKYSEEYRDKAFGKTDKVVQEEYAKAMGYDYVKNEKGNVGIYYKDGQTVAQGVQINDQTARQYLALQAALKESIGEEKANSIMNTINAASKLEDGQGDALLGVLSGEGVSTFIRGKNYASWEELKEAGVDTNLLLENDAEIQNKYEQATTAQQKIVEREQNDRLAALGLVTKGEYNDANELINTITRTGMGIGSKNVLNARADSNLIAFQQQLANDAGERNIVDMLNGIDTDTADSYVEYLEKVAAGGLGRAGSAMVSDMLLGITEGKTPEQVQEILQKAMSVDINSDSFAEDFKAAMAEVGVAVGDIDTSSLQELADGINIKPVTEDIENLTANVLKLNEALSKLGLGKKISQEVLDDLKKFIPNIEDYFVKTLDGYIQTKEIDDYYQNGIDVGKIEAAKTGYDNYNNKLEDRDAYTKELKDQYNGNLSGYVTAALSEGGAAKAYGVLNGLINDDVLSDELLQGAGFVSKDYFRQLLLENSNNADWIQNTAVKEIQDLLNAGNADNLDAEVAQTTYLASANSMYSMQSRDGFYGTNGEITEAGAKAMEAFATKTELGRKALDDYYNSIEGVEEGTEAWNEANEKLKNSLRQIEVDKAGEEVYNLRKSMSGFTKDSGPYNEACQKIAESLESVFGPGITAEWVSNNLDVVDAWDAGGEGAELAAQKIANASDVVSNAQKKFEETDWTNITSVKDYASETLGMAGDDIDNFVSNVTTGAELLNGALTNLDGKVVQINGRADFSNLLEEMKAAGLSAEQVQSVLAATGMSDIKLEFDDNGTLKSLPQDFTPEQFQEWWKQFSDGKMTLSGSGLWPADAPTPNMKNYKKKGGGGGGKAKKTEKKKQEAGDRYHTVNQQLEDVGNELDKIDNLADRAFGPDKIDKMTKSIEKLNQQLETQNRKLAEAKDYYKQDLAEAQKFANEMSIELQLGANGEILNWDELRTAYNNWYNQQADLYDAGKIDDDTFKEQVEEKYKDAFDAFNQYEETNNLIQDLEKDALETQQKIRDGLMEIAETKLEIGLQLNDNDLEYIEYQLKKLDDDLYDSLDRVDKIAEKISNLEDQSDLHRNAVNDLIAANGLDPDEIERYLKMSNEELTELFGGEEANVQKFVDDLQKEYKDLLSTNEDLMEERKNLVDEIGKSFKAWNDELDKNIDKIEDNAKLMEHYRNVVDIVGRKTLGIGTDFIKDYNLKQINNDLATLSSEVAQLEEMRAEEARLANMIIQANDEETKKLLQKQLDDITDQVNKQTEQTAQAWEDAMRGIQEAYEDTVAVALQDWKDKLAGLAGSAEMLQMSFDMANDIDEDYLKDYDKIYELSKLTRDINNSIDDTDNLRGKEDLIELLNEINELEESGAEVSQYKVDSLRAEYELLLAKQQVEEAQNAKDMVRMTRDNEGNWMYVYTANQDKVSEAEQNLADKLHAYEELTQNYIDDLDKKMADLSDSISEKLEKISQDTALTAEEKMQKMTEVADWANTQLQYYNDEMEIVTFDAQKLLEDDVNIYAGLTNTRVLNDEKWKQSFEDTKLSQITGLETLEDYYNNFKDSLENVTQDCINSTEEFAERNEEAFNLIGMTIENAKDKMTTDLEIINDDTNTLNDSIVALADEAGEAIDDLLGKVNDWDTQWGQKIENIIQFNEQLSKSCKDLIQILGDAQAISDAQAMGLNTEFDSDVNGVDNGGSTITNPGGGRDIGGDGPKPTGQYEVTGSSWDRTSTQHRKITYRQEKMSDGSKRNVEPATGAWVNHTFVNGKCVCGLPDPNYRDTKSITYAGGSRKEQIFDTGGYTGLMQYADTGMYTGEWPNGSVRANGRLALLHQKELVLNAHDTENFLNAVDIVRDLNETLDLNALSAMKGIGVPIAGLLHGEQQSQLDQNVQITAEFPNVTDRNEIQEAFNNLINRASQYANRKN